jgi:hypothetical protein
MLSKRLVCVLLLLAALCGYVAVSSGTDAQSDGTPPAGTPIAMRIGGVEPSPVSETHPPELPACIECYFGLWQLNVPGEVTVPPIDDPLMAFIVSGTATIDPDVAGIDESTQAFAWPSGVDVTVSTEDDSATLYFFGLVPGRGASDIEGLTLLGGAAFTAQPAQPYSFVIAKLTLTESSPPLVFAPDTWPAILNVAEGDVEITTAQSSLIAEDRVIDVTSFDEFGPSVHVLEPATLVYMTRAAGADGDVVVWFTGIYSSAPTGGPGCGWHCHGP